MRVADHYSGRNLMTAPPLLTMEGITKTFPGVRALEDVNLSVESGEIHALIGKNGAGKSTLIRILGGVYQPDEGRILIAGQEVNWPRRRLQSLKASPLSIRSLVSCQHLVLLKTFSWAGGGSTVAAGTSSGTICDEKQEMSSVD